MRHSSIKIALLMGVATSLAFAAPNPAVVVCPQAAFDSMGFIGGQSNALYESNVAAQGTCNLAIVKNADGSFSLVMGNQVGYDGSEDQLIGVVNNSNTTITSLNLNAATPAPPPPFAFDGDGICQYVPFISNPQPCNAGTTGYTGAASSFSNINPAKTSGTVNFSPGIPPGGTAYFSLEGPVGNIIVYLVQLGKTFAPSMILANGTTTMTLTVTNKSSGPITNVAFSDNLTLASLIATTPAVTVVPNCGTFTVTTTSVTFAGATLAAGATCSVAVPVMTTIPAPVNPVSLPNTTTTVTYNEAGPDAAATSTLQVVPGPPPAMLTPPVFTKGFVPPTITVGGTSILTLKIVNPNLTSIGVSFTDPLPLGVLVTGVVPPNPVCGGTLTVTAANNIALAGATIAGGATCTISLAVQGNLPGGVQNTTSQLGVLDLSLTNPMTQLFPAAMAPLTVTPATQPSIMKTFGAGALGIGATTAITFKLTNPNLISLTNVAFTDSLVGEGLTATAAVTNNVCGTGTLTVAATNIALAGATLTPGGSCMFTVNVTATGTAGLKTNVTSTLTSNQAPPGDPSTAAINIFDPTVDAYQVNYFANLPAGDSVVDISNSGASGAAFQSGTTAAITGAICANVYTFSPDEQLISCCSCPVTPNGLVSLSVIQDLVSNPLTPAVPTSGVIKLIATTPVAASCTNSASQVAGAALAPGMLAWGTTLHPTPQGNGVFGVTERPFIKSTISAAELTRLSSLCGFIQSNGSGFGVCKVCRFGGLGAEPAR